MPKSALAVLCLLLLAPLGPGQALDSNGDVVGAYPPRGSRAPGDLISTLALTISSKSVKDLAHDGTNLIVSVNGTALYVIDESTGVVTGTIPVTGFAGYGVGYDSLRNVYVNSCQTYVATYDGVNPAPVNQWYLPTSSAVGVAYDSKRDLYWVADWKKNKVYGCEPTFGGIPVDHDLAGFGCTRSSGVAYDAVYDELIIGSRDTNRFFVLDPASGSSIVSFRCVGYGLNNPEGCCSTPRSTLWQSKFFDTVLYQLSTGHGGMTPTIVDVTCNGGDTGVVVPSGTNAMIDFDVKAGSAIGTPVDIWIVLISPFGPFCYDGLGPISGWYPGLGSMYRTGPLADVNGTCLDRPVPVGPYKCHVGIDTVANGIVNVDSILQKDTVDFQVF